MNNLCSKPMCFEKLRTCIYTNPNTSENFQKTFKNYYKCPNICRNVIPCGPCKFYFNVGGRLVFQVRLRKLQSCTCHVVIVATAAINGAAATNAAATTFIVVAASTKDIKLPLHTCDCNGSCALVSSFTLGSSSMVVFEFHASFEFHARLRSTLDEGRFK